MEKLFTLRMGKHYGWNHSLGITLIYSIRNSSSHVCLFSIWEDERNQEFLRIYGRKTEKSSQGTEHSRESNKQIKEDNTKKYPRKKRKEEGQKEHIKNK